MADSGKTAGAINSAAQSVNQTINNAVNQNTDYMGMVGDDIVNAINTLGDGLVLTAKKETNDKAERDLKSELDGLRVFSPEMADIVDLLLSINTTTINTSEKQPEEPPKSADTEEEVPIDTNIDTSVTDIGALGSLTKIEDITGTGFALVANILREFSGILAEVLNSVQQSGALNGALIGKTEEITASEKAKEEKADTGGGVKGVLANFFTGLASAFESIAGGLLLLSIAIAILSTIEFNAQLLGTIFMVGTFMLTTFFILSQIQAAYYEYQSVLDTDEGAPKGNGSILDIVKMFALMVGITTGTLLLCGIMVQILRETWMSTLAGLLIIFGVALVTMLGLTAVATLMNDLTGENSPIMQFIKAFATMIGTILVLALLCFFLHNIIITGLGYAMDIMLTAGVMMLSLGTVMVIMSESGVTAEQIEAFKNLMIVTVALIGILALLTIVLGILPQELITQGLITVTALVGLVVLLLGMLTIGIKAIQEVNEAQLYALMGILIVTTAMIAILSILVLVLGSQEISTILQGMLILAVIMAIPFVIIKVMAKLGQQTAQMAQALLGIAMASIVTLAITLVAAVIITAFAPFTIAQVLTAMAAVLLTMLLIVAVGAAAIGIAILTPYIAAAVPLAIVGIAMAGLAALALAVIGVLLVTILDIETARATIVAAIAVMTIATSLVLIAGVVIVLAALAIPLMLATGLAIMALKSLQKFTMQLLIFALVLTVSLPMLVSQLGQIDPAALGTAFLIIVTTLLEFAAIGLALVAFNIIAAVMIYSITYATYELVLLSVGMFAFVLALNGLIAIMDLLPQPASEDDSLFNTKGIRNAIDGLSDISKAVNEFVVPNPVKLLAMTLAMNFTTSFAKRLGQIGDENTINRVANLANSLATLAQQSTGLQDLAASIKLVATATKELEDIPEKLGTGNIEALTGELNTKLEVMQIQKPVEVDKTGEKLDAMLEAIQQLNTNPWALCYQIQECYS